MSIFKIVKFEREIDSMYAFPRFAIMEYDSPFAEARTIACCTTIETARRVKGALQNATKRIEYAGKVE